MDEIESLCSVTTDVNCKMFNLPARRFLFPCFGIPVRSPLLWSLFVMSLCVFHYNTTAWILLTEAGKLNQSEQWTRERPPRIFRFEDVFFFSSSFMENLGLFLFCIYFPGKVLKCSISPGRSDTTDASLLLPCQVNFLSNYEIKNNGNGLVVVFVQYLLYWLLQHLEI